MPSATTESSAAQYAAQWSPATRLLASRGRDTAIAIARALPESPVAWTHAPITDSNERATRDISISWGSAGMATLFFELWQETGDEHWHASAVREVAHAFEVLETTDATPTLFGGLVGVLWIGSRLGLDVSSADDLLLEYVVKQPPGGPYDLLAGLVGIGVYALEHSPALVDAIVRRLANSTVRKSGPAYWLTTARELNGTADAQYPDGRYDLSMSHGAAGVIAFCAAAVRSHDSTEAELLLRRTVTFMTENARAGYPRFPLHTTISGSPMFGRRPAWCYGDLGIAAALSAAAGILADDEMARMSLRAALTCASDEHALTDCDDHSLCHGASGVAQVFRRLHSRLGDPRLLRAADAWLERALSLAHPNRGYAGFGVLESHRDTWQWKIDPGFLMGAAGCALAFLSASSNREPSWDRLLLLS